MSFEAPDVCLGKTQLSTSGDIDPARKDDLRRVTQNGPTGRSHSPPTAFSRRRGRSIPAVIIHHSALLRAGLAHILAETQFRVTTQCCSFENLPLRAFAGEQCVALIGIDDFDPGVILSEIPYLKSHDAHVHVIVLGEQLPTRELLSFIEAGADGYLLISEITAEALLRCLEMVMLGGVVIPRGSISIREDEAAFLHDAPDLIENAPPSTPAQPMIDEPAQSLDFARLSNREQTILRKLMQGASNKHIARCFDIAEATVKVHVRSLLRKLGVKNRTQAAMWAKSYLPEISSNSGAVVTGMTEAIDLAHPAQAFPAHGVDGGCPDIARCTPQEDGVPVSSAPPDRKNEAAEASPLSPKPTKPSPMVDDVVRFLRQEGDIVVRAGEHQFLVNGRFRLCLEEMTERANRMRARQGKQLFTNEALVLSP